MDIYALLSKIKFPSDLRSLKESDLPQLCEEIRAFMVDTITNVGGHLGAGLGVVELTVALHYVFNTPNDKIIFDVGHQGYPHKILTGRKELLHTIRQKNGISGFLRRSESEYDAFGGGHASTSISAALGMSVANDFINGKKNSTNRKFIAILGDGSLTGGLAYEGLNNAGFMNRNVIVILNDNNISIDKNISAFSNYFNDLFSSQRVQNWKDNIWVQLGGLGSKGDRMRRLASRFEGSMKSIITPGMLFEAVGFNYFGPINGNNIFKLIKILRNIKNLNGPLFLHIITEKGKGYKLAEDDKYKLHSVDKKPNGTSATPSQNFADKPLKYQDVFGQALVELFAKDNKLIAITAAMIDGTGLSEVKAKHSGRVIDVGIAESHAVVFAAGMATQGIVPIVAIYSSFMQRAFDNVIHDCALQNLHVVFALDRAGLVGEDGATHHGAFDIAYLRIIPNLVLMAPKDAVELRDMLYSAIYDYTNSCVAIRYPRGNTAEISSLSNEFTENFTSIPLGKFELLKDGDDLCIIALGRMVEAALQASETLGNDEARAVAVVNARFVKPLDIEMLDAIASKFKNIITVEDGQKIGGFGSAVLEYFSTKRYHNNIVVLGIGDHFVEHGNVELLLGAEGLDANAIIEACKNMI